MSSPTPSPTQFPEPPLAYRNGQFLDSDEARPLRILAEYLQPMHTFQRQRVHDTIVFFGSARVREEGPLSRYYADARELAARITKWSAGLKGPAHRFVVSTGGGPGIMEAANRGATDAGGRSVGLNISLPYEQHPNAYITPALSFDFHYFFMRKLWFAHLARALVVFPGGFGTLDEMFEMLTLAQTRKLDPPVLILLYGSSYWNEIINFPALVRHGMIDEADLRCFRFVDSPDDAMDALRCGLETAAGEPGPCFARSAHENAHARPASAATTGNPRR